MKNKIYEKIKSFKSVSLKTKIIFTVIMVIIASVTIGLVKNHKSKAKDYMVLEAQEWLNDTYSGITGYENISEDGILGQGTEKALIRALQIELGLTPDGGFGTKTFNACPTIKSTDSTKTNIVKILQYGLFCKGYDAGECDGTYHSNTISAIKSIQSDAGISQDGIVKSKLFKAILNTDALVLIKGGDEKVRAIQQTLNNKYSDYFIIIPCDGICATATSKAIIYGLQAEIGATIDGGFGNGTLSLCPKDFSKCSQGTRFIIQAALYFNGYYSNGNIDGTYNSYFASEIEAYRKFMCLPKEEYSFSTYVVNEAMGITNSLVTSRGERNRPGTGCDTSTRLTAETITTIKDEGYKYVGRYLTKVEGGLDKNMTQEEAKLIIASGLKIIPIYQTYGRETSYFTETQGNIDAIEAITAATNLGIPYGSTIYFGVDYDMHDYEVTSNIIPYFYAIKSRFDGYGGKYKIGIYGCRNACTRVCNEGLASYCYVSDMSTGFQGNIGYKMPTNWAFDQIDEYTKYREIIDPEDETGETKIQVGKIGLDKLIVSGRDTSVSRIDYSMPKTDYFTVAEL